jgi:hypothetical protein
MCKNTKAYDSLLARFKQVECEQQLINTLLFLGGNTMAKR